MKASYIRISAIAFLGSFAATFLLFSSVGYQQKREAVKFCDASAKIDSGNSPSSDLSGYWLTEHADEFIALPFPSDLAEQEAIVVEHYGTYAKEFNKLLNGTLEEQKRIAIKSRPVIVALADIKSYRVENCLSSREETGISILDA